MIILIGRAGPGNCNGNELAKVTGTLNNALSNAKRGGVGYLEEC